MNDHGFGVESGLELWRLLKYKYDDRASAFNVRSVLQTIRNMTPVRWMQHVLPKIASLDRAHQDYQKHPLASKGDSSPQCTSTVSS